MKTFLVTFAAVLLASVAMRQQAKTSAKPTPAALATRPTLHHHDIAHVR
jgi:hypothetical protein